MPKLFVLSYCALSFVGTAAYCILWIDSTWPVLNILWLVFIPVIGSVLGIKLRRDGVDAQLRRLLLGHALLCVVVGAWIVTWPGLVLLATGEIPERPPHAIPVSLLPLAPYSLLIVRPKGAIEKVIFSVVVLAVLLPSQVALALWGFGVLLIPSDDGPPLFDRTVSSPAIAVIAHHEVRRWSGGVFPDTQGRVWLQVPGLPLRQLIYQYWTDTGWHVPEGGVVRWKDFRTLDFTLPSDSHGGAMGPLLGFRGRYSREDDR
jgi:hypothetical protein